MVQKLNHSGKDCTMKKLITGALVVALSTVAFACTPVAPVTDGQNTKITAAGIQKMEAEILSLINKHRAGKGLKALSANAAMATVAAEHSSNMAKGKTAFGHNGFDARVKKISASTGTLKAWAENVARGQISAKEVVNGWLNSPGHRKNIEGNYNLSGIGVVAGKNGELFFTHIFGLK